MKTLEEKSRSFIVKCYEELGKSSEEIENRIEEIKQDIINTGSYTHTTEELSHGARMAWRNSNKCIGRLFWESLSVVDARNKITNEDVYGSLADHLRLATNKGKIQPAITVFAPRENEKDPIKIYNHQLIRYAGYETGNGIIGDPHSIAFTSQCNVLGWQGKGTEFDLLPLVISTNQGEPVWFELDQEIVKEVQIRHPKYPGLADLNLKWYAVPAVSDMILEIGGIDYPAAPFNGWYMGTEIGARNLADEARYNKLPVVADAAGIERGSNASLWKDEALVLLNQAVLHSFHEDGVSIVDHHTAAHQFKQFEKNETQKGRQITGDWTWLIPPISPATTHIFHEEYDNSINSPTFRYK